MNNNEIFESRWEQIRSQSRLWWSLFSDDDLDKVEKAPVKRDKYVTMLQVKYGYTREHAREEITRRMVDLGAEPVISEIDPASLDKKKSKAASKARKTPARKLRTAAR